VVDGDAFADGDFEGHFDDQVNWREVLRKRRLCGVEGYEIDCMKMTERLLREKYLH